MPNHNHFERPDRDHGGWELLKGIGDVLDLVGEFISLILEGLSFF
jgi:hypothetical protein